MVVPIMLMLARVRDCSNAGWARARPHALAPLPAGQLAVLLPLLAYRPRAHKVHSVLDGHCEIGALHCTAVAGEMNGDDSAVLIEDRPAAIARIRGRGVLVFVALGVIGRVVGP